MSVLIWVLAAGAAGAGVFAWRLVRPLSAEELKAMHRAHWLHTRRRYPDVYWTDAPPPEVEKSFERAGVEGERSAASLGGFERGYSLSTPGASSRVA